MCVFTDLCIADKRIFYARLSDFVDQIITVQLFYPDGTANNLAYVICHACYVNLNTNLSVGRYYTTALRGYVITAVSVRINDSDSDDFGFKQFCSCVVANDNRLSYLERPCFDSGPH